MFENPLAPIMFMHILYFIGILVMFLFVIKALSQLNRSFRDTARQQQIALADIERQLMDINFLLRKQSGNTSSEQSTNETAVDSSFIGQSSNDLLDLLSPLAKTTDKPASFIESALTLDVGQTGKKEPAATSLSPLDIHLER